MAEELRDVFDFDDFFDSDESPGILIEPEIRGRKVPIYVRRGISIDNLFKVRDRVAKKAVVDGAAVEISLDEATMNSDVLAELIVSWPFTRADKKNPSKRVKVPITPDNCARMFGDAAEKVWEEINVILNGRRESLVPFEKPSDEAI